MEEVRRELETEVGQKYKETGHKMGELDGLIRKMEEEVQNLNGTTTNNANDIRVLSDNDAKLDARLEKIETEASALAEELAETQAGHDETLNKTVEDLAELKSDLIVTAEKLQATDDKRQEQVSIPPCFLHDISNPFCVCCRKTR